MRVVLTPHALDTTAELAAFRGDTTATGALVSFIGYCRGSGPEDSVLALELTHYPGFTESEISRLGALILEKHESVALLVIHRTGRVHPGEAIVLVASTAPHRAAAFACAECMMDYLKTDAPFWKREVREDGAHRIEPTEEDLCRRNAHQGQIES